MAKHKILYRSGNNRMIGGVCAGIGEYLNLDPNIIRIAWWSVILLFWVSGIFWLAGLLLYLIAWIIIPVKSL